jgi:Flp pilus assembly protein TadD
VPTLVGWRAAGSYPIGERYLYLAVFGVALLVAHGCGTGRWRSVPWLLVLACAPLSFVGTGSWRDQGALVTHGLSIAPNDPNLRVMAGDVALATDPVRAAADYAAAERAAAAASGERPHRALAAARLGLAWSLFQQQQGQRGPGTPQLVAAFQRAVDTDPSVPAAWVGLGVAFGVAGRNGDAERAFREALARDADHPEAWFNLGFLQARMGRDGDARASLQQALRCNPGNARARQLLQQLR